MYVHSRKAVDNHVWCRIVQVVGKFYRLCSMEGVLCGRYSSESLAATPLGEWRQCPIVSLCDVTSDPACVERCNCTRNKSPLAAVGDLEESCISW